MRDISFWWFVGAAFVFISLVRGRITRTVSRNEEVQHYRGMDRPYRKLHDTGIDYPYDGRTR